MMNYFGLNRLLVPGPAMPIIDIDELRIKHADFCHRFCEHPYYLIRAKNPQLLLDKVEKLCPMLDDNIPKPPSRASYLATRSKSLS